MKTIELHDGTAMPALGLGTWKSSPGEVGRAVEAALRMGYRHIDCAAIYGNEKEVGEALARCLRDGVVDRSELWITSKLWNDCHARDEVVPALRRTLADLRLDRLDLYLVHWPVAMRRGAQFPREAADLVSLEAMPLSETWAGMEDAARAGLCRHVGVSNFSARKLGALLDHARMQPAVNQVELHPRLRQQALVDFCRDRRIAVTAYSPLGSPDRPAMLKQPDEPSLLASEVVLEVAERRGATAAQVLIAWALQRGTSVIPKSVDPKRMEENLAATEVALTGEDMAALDGLDRRFRYVRGALWTLPGGPYTLANLWDEEPDTATRS